MENRNNNGKIIAIFALVIAVVGLSVAYASFSSSLTINGTATVSSNWDIEWTNLNGTKTGYANIENATLAIQTGNQSILGSIGELAAPGDTITWNWNVENKGSIDATLASATTANLVCAPASGSAATQGEANALCADLSLALVYDGITVSGSADYSAKADLTASASRPVSMTLTYSSSSTATISGPVAVSLDATPTFVFNQK